MLYYLRLVLGLQLDYKIRMTSANLTVALPTADATVGDKTSCRLTDDQMKDMEEGLLSSPGVSGNSSDARFVLSSPFCF